MTLAKLLVLSLLTAWAVILAIETAIAFWKNNLSLKKEHRAGWPYPYPWEDWERFKTPRRR